MFICFVAFAFAKSCVRFECQIFCFTMERKLGIAAQMGTWRRVRDGSRTLFGILIGVFLSS